MTTTPRTHSPAITRLLALATALLLTLAVVPTASAHDRLVSSTPGDGEVATTVPDALVLTYNAEIQTIGADVTVVAPDGTEQREGDLVLEGTQVRVPLRTDAAPGAYQVTWRVTSSDGHPIDGSFSFTLDVPAPEPTPESTPEPTPAPTEEPSATSTEPETSAAPSTESSTTDDSTDTETSTADATATTSTADDENGGVPVVVWVIAAVVLVGGAVTAVVLRRRRTV